MEITKCHIRPASPMVLLLGIMMTVCMDPVVRNPIESGQTNQLAVALSSVPTQFTDSLVASGLTQPTLMDLAPDGRIFVSEKNGNLRVIKNNALLPTPFLTVNVSTTGERGLLGVVLDPDFAANRFIYVYYTSPIGPHNQVSRFTASAANPDVAEAGSEVVIFDLPVPASPSGNHNGGSIKFVAADKLYIAVGDAANGANSQSLNTTFGKILRINKDGSIPSDNPFFASTSGNNRAIWALGFRNPFAFSVEPVVGHILVNDVGEQSQEEIDWLGRGENYGWPTSEGNLNTAGFTAPVYAYTHAQGCAITGGDFYNPSNPTFPQDMIGDYFFADFCGGWISRLDLASGIVTQFATASGQPTDIQVGGDGVLYYLEYASGQVRRIKGKRQSILLEAESASKSGPIIASLEPGYTGSGYLDFQNSSGDWVEFSGFIRNESAVPLTLRYANGSGAPIQMRVTLSGAVIAANLS